MVKNVILTFTNASIVEQSDVISLLAAKGIFNQWSASNAELVVLAGNRFLKSVRALYQKSIQIYSI